MSSSISLSGGVNTDVSGGNTDVRHHQSVFSGSWFGGPLLGLHRPKSMPRLTPVIVFSITSARSDDILMTATLGSILDTRQMKSDTIELPQGWAMFRTRE